jgi:putative MATE family efflux protein
MQNKKKENYAIILRQLTALSWPIALAFVMQKSYHIIDLFWVGKLGAIPIAAISLAGTIFYIVLSVGQLLGSGMVALVAHSFGARLIDRANSIAKQSLFLAALIAFIVSVSGFIFSKQLMILLGGKGAVLSLSSMYLRIVFIGFFFQLMSFSINYVFRGAGDMKTPMRIMLVATAINIVLDPLLIFGIGFFPRLEVQGAAIATAIANFASFLYGFTIMVKGKSEIKLKIREKWHMESHVIKSILRVGIPVGISYALMGLSIMSVFRIVTAFSEYALAALGIGNHILQFASLPIVVSIGIATTTLVGQSLGARNLKKAIQIGAVSILMSATVMLFFSILFYTNARVLINLFTQNTDVINYGIGFMHIVSLYLIFISITTSLTGVFRGAGDTLPPMFSALLKLALLWILALLFANRLGMGVTGVWWAMFVAYGIETLVIVIWYKAGAWRKKGLALLENIRSENT